MSKVFSGRRAKLFIDGKEIGGLWEGFSYGLDYNGSRVQVVASQGAPPFCGMCGKTYVNCDCLAELKIDTDRYTSPWDKPIQVKPKAIPAPLPPARSDYEERVEKAKARIRSVLGVRKTSPCYLCARADRPLVEVKNGGMLICEPCAVEHLGD